MKSRFKIKPSDLSSVFLTWDHPTAKPIPAWQGRYFPNTIPRRYSSDTQRIIQTEVEIIQARSCNVKQASQIIGN
jgi:hypothetical protein